MLQQHAQRQNGLWSEGAQGPLIYSAGWDGGIEIVDPAVALRAVIAACAAHRMRRPALARLVGFAEARMPAQGQEEARWPA